MENPERMAGLEPLMQNYLVSRISYESEWWELHCLGLLL